MIIDSGLRLAGTVANPAVAQAITATAVSTNIVDLSVVRDLDAGNDIYAVFTPTALSTAGMTALTSTLECQIIGSVGPGPYTAPTVAVTGVTVATINGQALTVVLTVASSANIANGQPIYMSGTITAPVGAMFGGSTGTLQVSSPYYAVVFSATQVGLSRTYAQAIAAAAALASGSPFVANTVAVMTSVTTTTPTINQITWLLGTSGAIVVAWNDAAQTAGTLACPFNPGGSTGGYVGPQIVVDLCARPQSLPITSSPTAGVTGSPGPIGARYVWANFVATSFGGGSISLLGDIQTQDVDSRKAYTSGFAGSLV
jgi:hypothetical protein